MDKRSILFALSLTLVWFAINHLFFPSNDSPPLLPEKEVSVSSPSPTSSIQKEAVQKESFPSSSFYMIETDLEQLVFCEKTASLAEINLKLYSKDANKEAESVIKPIRVDKILQKDYPEQDLFPLYPAVDAQGKSPQPVVGGYYPLLRRKIPASHFAFNLVDKEGNLLEQDFHLTQITDKLIEFEGKVGSARVTKTFSFPQKATQAPYCIELNVKIEGQQEGMWINTGIPEVEIISGNSSPLLKYRQTRSKKSKVEQLSLPKESSLFTESLPDWVCNSNGFLGVVLDPLNFRPSSIASSRIEGTTVPTRLHLIDTAYNLYPLSKYPGYSLRIPFEGKETQNLQFRIYAGPFDSRILKQVDRYYADHAKRYNPDYSGCVSFHGWFSFISAPFAKFLFFLMEVFHFLTHSWGLSIILLTGALRFMMYPLNAWSIKSNTKMQKLSPKVTALQEKYKKDPKRSQMEVLKLYRENGVNPLGGCLPLLIQMPFLIGMFDLLKSTFQLRGASFIPGWIDNLSAPDVLFSWGYPLWFFGTSFHLLPFLVGITMYWQQKTSGTIPQGKELTEQQKQQKMMGNIMSVASIALFYHFPSGLNIYWIFSMLLAGVQQNSTILLPLKKKILSLWKK